MTPPNATSHQTMGRLSDLDALQAQLEAAYGKRKPAYLRIPLNGPSDYQDGCFEDENAEHRTYSARNGSVG